MAIYGDYIRCAKEEEQEVKDLLLEQMVAAVRELSKEEGFWLVNNVECEQYEISVGYKFAIPHLLPKDVPADAGKWIPVAERKPDLIPCSAGTGYSEAVLVWTSGSKVMVAVWDGVDFLCAARYWDAEGEEITHWTPLYGFPNGQDNHSYTVYAPTIADRIRSMSDEELVDHFWEFMPDNKFCAGTCHEDEVKDCNKCRLAWLRQPAEEL